MSVWPEAHWTVDQIIQKVGRAPNNMRKFKALSVNKNTIGLQWLEPKDSYDADGNLLCSVGGVAIYMSEHSYPVNLTDGKLVIKTDATGLYESNVYKVTDLKEGQRYYFSAFPFSTVGVYSLSQSSANRASDEPHDFTAQITVYCPREAKVTCALSGQSSTQSTAKANNGSVEFVVHKAGTYVVKAADGNDFAETTVKVTSDKQKLQATLSFVHIFGIKRKIGSESPLWERTDYSENFTAKASIGTVAGHSDFDGYFPWKGMRRVTLNTDDVMVEIPKFYFRRYAQNGYEYIQIADKAKEGFAVHSLFKYSDEEHDKVYLAAYETSNDGKSSKSECTATVDKTRSNFRSAAKSKGNGWSLMDIAALSAVQMLYLVEFASNDSQKTIGRGYVDGNKAACRTGGADTTLNLTGIPVGPNGKVSVVYRGIENLWGNLNEWVDGVNLDEGKTYTCTDPNNYADDTSSNYSQLNYELPVSGYISEEGIDANNSYAILPCKSGASETTGYCDEAYPYERKYNKFALCLGSSWSSGSGAGLFCVSGLYASSKSGSWLGARLLYRPR